MEMCSNKHMHQKYKKEHSNKIIFHFGFIPSDCVQCKCVHVYEIVCVCELDLAKISTSMYVYL